MLELPNYHCLRCHWTWTPRTGKVPVQCPGCTTTFWNREYRRHEYVTQEVLTQLFECKMNLCQTRYHYWLEQLGLAKPPTPSKAPVNQRRNKKRLRPIQVTRDNLPKGFKRIK